MVDFSKIFNLAFVVGAGALALFLFVSALAVAAKGARKCNAFDVILRILSTLAFIAATAMLAAAILSMLVGGVCITLDPVPTLVVPGATYVLPLADLFLLLATPIGFGLAIALFMCSLAALVVDCLVANKKDKKASRAKPAKKTPEQLKREAELARIRKIGESAVKKTSDVARAQDEQTVAAKSEDTATAEQEGPENTSDWRDEPTPQSSNEFVGLNNEVDEAFDSFDRDADDEQPSDDDGEQTAEEYEPEQDVYEDVAAPEEETVYDEPVAEEEPVADNFDEYAEEEDHAPSDIPDENDNELAQDVEEPVEEEPVADELSEEPVAEEEPVADEPIAEEPVVDELAEEEPVEERSAEEELVADEPIAEELAEEEPVAEDVVVEEEVKATESEQAEQDAAVDYGDIEPDRDIYIPEIRTINKPSDDGEPERKPTAKRAAKKPSGTTARKGTTAKKQTSGAKKSTGGEEKPAPSGRRTAATQRPTAAQRRRTAPPPAPEVPEEKKLPVTRRYVILDRRNAVNMFGEYLRERNKADKEKLQSSINTIIIE